jgi:hypothetical protein
MAVSRLSGARLTRKGEKFLAQIWTELRKSGASDTDIEKATAGLVQAIFANSRIEIASRALKWVGGFVIMNIILWTFFLFPYDKFIDIKSTSRFGEGLIAIIFFSFVISIISSELKQDILTSLDNEKHHYRTKLHRYRIIFVELIEILVTILLILIPGFFVWREWFSNIEEISIWKVAVVILSGVWVISFWNITIKLYRRAEPRILAFFRPESALIISLSKAFLAVRNEASWHDQTYRDRIAGHLAVAIDAVEKFMPRGIAAEAGLSSLAAVR